ncbi:MAG: hypothetical protein II695_04545, partial [Oscillospiraceae bacterium]|nr:hypothetical protein [Oscillospiraceae bacterium]
MFKVSNTKITRSTIAGIMAAMAAVSAMSSTVSAYDMDTESLSGIFSGYISDKSVSFDDTILYCPDYTDAVLDGASVDGYAGFAETINTDLISTTLVGIAGDEDQPRILVDVRINDKNFVKKHDRFFIVTKTIGAEIYEQGLDDEYGVSYGFAVQDKADPSLYHISVDAPIAWLINGEETVFSIEGIKGYSTKMLEKYHVTEQEVMDYWNYSEQLSDEKAGVFMTFEEYDIDDIMYHFIVPENVFDTGNETECTVKCTADTDGTETYVGIGETINTPKFSTTLVGISGTDEPKIHVDLRVNDKNISSKYDIFFITGRTLGAEEFDSDRRENYGIDYGFGVR